MPAVLLAAAAVGAACVLRLLAIEPPEAGWLCQGDAPPWWCPLRTALIVGLRAGALGVVALAAGLMALLRGSRGAAMLAIGAGAAGLVLYAPELAAGGALLGALALCRA